MSAAGSSPEMHKLPIKACHMTDLKVTAADEKINRPATLLFQVLEGTVDFLQFTMRTAFNSNLHRVLS